MADKLSRLLADSPSSPSPPATDPPIASHESQAVSFSSEELTSPKKSTFSSYILSLLPTSSGIDADKPNSPARPHSRVSPSHLLPARWEASGFAWKDRPLDHSEDCLTESESDETTEILKENLDQFSERNINSYNGIEEATASHDSEEYLPSLSEKSAFISADLFEFLQSSLPHIVKGCQWVLLYRAVRGNMGYHFTRFFVGVLISQAHVY